MRFMILQMAISFLAKSICADGVAVCALFVYRWASIIASFSHVVFAITERRARHVKTKHDRVFTIFV